MLGADGSRSCQGNKLSYAFHHVGTVHPAPCLTCIVIPPTDPAIARIVEDECKRRGVPYAHYDTLPQIIARFSA